MDNAFDLVRAHARTAPGQIALLGDAGSWSYGNLAAASDRIAAEMAGLGCRGGDRITILTGNELTTPVLLLAAHKARLWPAIVNANLPQAEIARLCDKIDPRMIFAADDDAATRLGHLSRCGKAQHLALPGGGQVLFIPRLPETRPECGPPAALLLPASVIGGRSRVLVYSHRALHWLGQTTRAGMQITMDARCETGATMMQAAGITVLTAVLQAGACLRLRSRPDVAARAADLRGGHLTHLALTPLTHAEVLDHLDSTAMDATVHGLRHLSSGGADLDSALHRRIGMRYGVTPVNTYGLREYPCILRTRAGGGFSTEPGTEIRFRPETAIGGETGQISEIQVRGPGAACGYFRDVAATAKTFLPDGWIATGDLAIRTPDGNIRLLGHRRDVIRRAQGAVYSCEVEAAINAHGAVHRSAVVWFPRSDGAEDVLAVIALRHGHQLRAADLMAHLRTRLAAHQIPTRVVFRPMLPLGEDGKILKRRLTMGLA